MLTPGTIAPTCPAMADGKFMKCHWMGQAIKGAGGVMTVLGLAYTAICCKKQMFFCPSYFQCSSWDLCNLIACKINWRLHEG